ncbi:MAG: hypothetical protein RLZZ437_3263 [Pseudomonadota bacterium]|jgi:hypothetical protein
MAYDATKALSFCQAQSGRYRDGECWTLVEDAVVGAGGTSSKKLTPNFSPASAYVWGTAVALAQLKPGDVLQFGGYEWRQTITTDVTNPPGSETGGSVSSREVFEKRGEPQHSAMVVSVVSAGVVTVIEQNIPATTGPVQTVQLVLIPRPKSESTTRVTTKDGDIVTVVTVTETVTAPPRAYRPK